ncbi:MAG TPA: MFS transporter [Herpetosiphonaceae bacterium]|nr:MFS transporter [Herpetosiphonaceae bacterium]
MTGPSPSSGASPPEPYFRRWRHLSRPAWLYLLHAGLLTSSLAIYGLFFNLLVLALGYPRTFLGTLNLVSTAVAAMLSVPIWWSVTRLGLRRALLASGLLQAISAFMCAFWPTASPLLLASALSGGAAVLFHVSAAPFMMRHSDAAARDHLFSANAAINIGFAGVGSLVAGYLPGLVAPLLSIDVESAAAYRWTFAIAGAGLVLSLIPLLLVDRGRTPTPARMGHGRPPVDDRPVTAGRRQERPIAARRLAAIRTWLNREPWRTIINHRWLIIQLLVPPALISCGAALLMPYLNLFFKETFAIPDTVLGQIFAALGITTGFAALAGPIISGRIGKIGTIILTQAVSIPFLLLLGFVPMLYVAVGAALARAALFNMGSPLFDAFAMERIDENARPVVIGLINGAYSAGYIVAPAISTHVQERYGFAPLFVVTAICYSFAVLANYWFFVRQGRRTTVREAAQQVP